ncbi:unnamed protein product, partial [Tetraodon nigroviridis]
MEGKVIGPGPYRATKLWNETIRLFRGGMPLRRHWAQFRCHDWSFTGSEAVDYLHELLRRNGNFGPEVTRYQTLQLLRKFLKAHVIEDIKGRHGTENFEDNGQLYRQFPTLSPLKSFPARPLLKDSGDLPRLIRWDDYEELSRSGNVAPQRSGVMRALGLVSLDGVLNPAHVSGKHIAHNASSVNKSGVVVLENKAEDMPYWVVSAMRCLASCECDTPVLVFLLLLDPASHMTTLSLFLSLSGPNGSDSRQQVYPGFERDVLRTVGDYFQRLKEPLLTFHLYEVFVNILSLLRDREVATEALQVSCLLLPPPNRRHLQLLLRFMARVCLNPQLPPLNDSICTRTLMVQMFSHCVLGSGDEMDLDELLATKLVTFMMEHHDAIFLVPAKLRRQVEEHLSHLKRAQIKYAGSDTDFSASPAFCKQICKAEPEEQKVVGTQMPLNELLEGLIADKELPAKDKRKRLKQFQRSYPDVYQKRFPTEESKAAVIPEKTPRFKPPLSIFSFKKPLQPFQRSWSFRA